MTLLIDREAAEELRRSTIAVSMNQRRFGNAKKLDDRIHKRASEAIKANPRWLKTKEVILQTAHPAYSAVLQHMDETRKEFRRRTVAYPEPTVRLVLVSKLQDLQDYLTNAQRELDGLVEEMDAHREFLIQQAKTALQDAFNPNHYPATFVGCFSIEIDYPTLGPDTRLQELNPELYQQQVERFRLMMDNAIVETTTALASELEKVFSSLSKSLESGRQIKPEAFKKLNGLIAGFEDIRIGTTPDIQRVVDNAREILSGRSMVEIERSVTARTSIARALAPLHNSVASMTEPIEERFIEL